MGCGLTSYNIQFAWGGREGGVMEGGREEGGREGGREMNKSECMIVISVDV